MKAGNNISFECALDEVLVKEIVINLHDKSLSFLELAQKLNLDLKNQENWSKLKLHLMKLENDGFLEERHFEEGTVDYCIDNKGLEMVQTLLRN